MSLPPDPRSSEPGAEILSLVDALVDAERRLDLLTAGEVDAVADRQGRTFLLRRAQNQLREAEARKQAAILNALPANVALLDAHGVIISVNERWRSFATDNGLDDSTFALGQNYLEIAGRAKGRFGTEGPLVADGIKSVLNGDTESYSIEYPCHSPNQRRWFLLRVSPVHEGELKNAVVMHVDITARRLAEDALRESEDRFRGTFEQVAVGMAHISKDGNFLRVNTKFCDLTGYERDDLLKQPIINFLCWEDNAECKEALRAMLAGERTDYVEEIMYLRKDGGAIWLNVMSTVKRGSDGGPDGFITVFNDVSERKASEFRLRRLNRLHSVLSKMGEAIVRTRHRQQLYDKACRLLVEDGLLKLAVIAIMDDATQRLVCPASYGEGVECLPDVEVSLEGPNSLGTVGTVLRLGIANCCNDMIGDPRMDPWRKTIIKCGLRSSAAFPLKLAEKTIGAMVLYSGEPDYFHDDELRLMSAVASELSFAIEVQEKEQERDRGALALKSSEANMAVAQGISHFGSWELDMSGKMDEADFPLRWSDEMYRIAGFDPTDPPAVSRSFFFGLVHPEDRPLIRAAMAAALQSSEKKYSLIHRLIRANGEERIVQEAAQIFYDPATGRPMKVVGTAHDITEQRKAEEAMARSESAYRELTQQLESERARLLAAQMVGRVGSWETDLTTMKVEWSDETHRIFQTERASFGSTHQEFLALIHPEDRSMVDELFSASFTDHKLHAVEHRLLLPDGRIKFVEERWQVFPPEDGMPARAIGTCQDITDRKKLESQILRAQRMESIGTLASGIAHDLNNVLSPILMSLEMLKDQVANGEGRALIGILENSALRAADLVKQVLSFAKGVEGRRISANLVSTLLEIQKIARDTFPKNITFRVNVPNDLWRVTGDPTQLHQVFMNLCVNARDAMPAGGSLTVEMENLILDDVYSGFTADAKPGSYVVVSVVDTGQGIPSHVCDKVFDPFFTTKPTGQGTGLGLSTTLAIVKSHGGFIHLYSEVGKGTTFKIFLPASMGPGPTGTSAAGEPQLPKGNGELLLLADDEDAVRMVGRTTLERFGYRVVVASNGAEAVALYAQRCAEIALVITDMAMPIMDGAATIIALRSVNPAVKIIASSGVPSNGEIVKALGLDANHFITKPYTAESLLTLIHRELSRTGGKAVFP